MEKWYNVLGVKANSNDEEVKKAYKKLIKKFHPDNGEKASEEKTKEIKKAYNYYKKNALKPKKETSLVVKKETAKKANMREETKKMILTLVVIVSMILIIPLSLFINNQKGEKIVNAVSDLFKDDGLNLAYIGSPDCGYCQLLQPSLVSLSKKYNFTYSYVNITKLNDSQFDRVLDAFDLEPKDFGTPYLAIVKNGKIIGQQPGYIEEDELFEFLQTNNIISEEEVYESQTPYLTKLSFAEYNKLIASETKEIIVITQLGCSACQYAKPILNEIAKENNIKINYLVINSIKSEEDYNNFMDSLSYFKETENWGTPLTLIVQKNELINVKDGYYNKADYVDFFKTNGFISE